MVLISYIKTASHPLLLLNSKPYFIREYGAKYWKGVQYTGVVGIIHLLFFIALFWYIGE